MFDGVMKMFWVACSICGILLIISNFLKATPFFQKFFNFIKRHRLIGSIFVILGALGIFNAIWSA